MGEGRGGNLFLLNDVQVRKYLDEKAIKIKPFESRALKPTWYEFRLGPQYEILDSDASGLTGVLRSGADSFKLPGKATAKIHSLERFEFTERVMGFFGQSSVLPLSGFRLGHSPFLDPTFEGTLEMSVENTFRKPATLTLGQLIGKISFFDVSDTYPIKKTDTEDWRRRRGFPETPGDEDPWTRHAQEEM